MRKLFISILLILGAVINANAAAPVTRGRGSGTPVATQSATSGAATTARSAVRGNAVRSTNAVRNTSVRSATTQPKTVAARAAVTSQKVINSGTKVAGAVANTAVNEQCQNKYYGCMDAFCMLDNTSGGRCVCSNRNAELDEVLAEIEKLDQQSYQMATYGVEKIEMGLDADAAIAKANAAAKDAIDSVDRDEKGRRKLDLSIWDNSAMFEEDDVFDIFGEVSSIDGKTGDALQRAASDLCAAQIPECAADMSMLKLLYAQKIKSDCNAYENSLKQQKSASQTKLATAERALRDAALEQLRAENRYDLGQCTIEFKKCMQTTGGCGNDFAACAMISAMDNTNTTQSTSRKAKSYSVKGSATTIEIAASSYDTLLSKKPLCETVTKQCVAVADKVWDTFLKEIAPQIKSAELIAEDNARQNCIGNISSCFQKACRDNIDPNDPDGSYDMCLTRPETMLNVCKIPLNACGIDASSASKAQKSQIWDFVVARLASMRVDSCTKEVKSCLQSEDRCGSDYTQCVGLDTDTIMRMCPYDKLVGCQKVYEGQDIRGNKVYDEIANMVQGIMLNIDNNMLTMCQKAADEAMIKVCGDTENCNGLAIDNGIGAHSLDYKICGYKTDENGNLTDIDFYSCRTDVAQIQDVELGRVEGSTSTQLGPITPLAGVIDGTIYWESVEVGSDGKLSSVEDYLTKVDEAKSISPEQKEKVKSELAQLQNSINNAINTIESDPTVQFCMYGREVQGMNKNVVTANGTRSTRTTIGSKENPRFPELTKQMRSLIASAALKQAKSNYYTKYDELNEKLLQDYATIGERMAEIQGKNVLDARREIARLSCLGLPSSSTLPKSPNPPKNAFGKILAAVAITGACVAVPLMGPAALSATAITVAGVTVNGVAVGATAVAGMGLLGNVGSGSANGVDNITERELVASAQLNQWNYKETITSTFEWETLNCHKCVRSQSCENTKNPLFGNKYCKDWGEEKETCTDTQF
ncbi:MAG: hypothetical protein IJ866_02430 [Alphaproteobacteria bacterium]|nr:hypothetical protein [Alphaproteobacteria bacterium]